MNLELYSPDVILLLDGLTVRKVGAIGAFRTRSAAGSHIKSGCGAGLGVIVILMTKHQSN